MKKVDWTLFTLASVCLICSIFGLSMSVQYHKERIERIKQIDSLDLLLLQRMKMFEDYSAKHSSIDSALYYNEKCIEAISKSISLHH
jgi:hypothetical protein